MPKPFKQIKRKPWAAGASIAGRPSFVLPPRKFITPLRKEPKGPKTKSRGKVSIDASGKVYLKMEREYGEVMEAAKHWPKEERPTEKNALQLLRSEHPKNRLMAMGFMVGVRDKRAIEPLKKIAANDEYFQLRKMAQTVLKFAFRVDVKITDRGTKPVWFFLKY